MNATQIIQNQKYIPNILIQRLNLNSQNTKEDKKEQRVAQAIDDVYAGKYGVNPTRANALKKAGETKGKEFDYTKVQVAINQGIKSGDDYLKTLKIVYSSQLEEIGLSETEIKNRLLSMNFSLSKSDVSGSFSLTFYPETSGGESIYDLIQIFDVVTIQEPNGAGGLSTVFQGIVKEKKISGQSNDSGGIRRLRISGISTAGLVSLFSINLDATAQSITKQFESDSKINELTRELGQGSPKPLEIKKAVALIWKYFLEIAEQNGTPIIEKFIKNLMVKNPSTEIDDKVKENEIAQIFDFDDSSFYYPLASVFQGQQTQNFFSVIDDLIPEPIYEKFAYFDSKQNTMRIKVRECPFSAEKWKNLTKTEISKKLLQSFDFSQSDSEVYTVFCAYLNGYPLEESKLLKLAQMEDKNDSTIFIDKEKYDKYGYRPLIAHFIGYRTQAANRDTSTAGNLAAATQKLKEWFGNLPEMLSGSATLSMASQTDCSIMPGEIVGLLGGQFYVEGVSHNWNYGIGGTVNLSLSRGGKYTGGKWERLEKVGALSTIMQNV